MSDRLRTAGPSSMTLALAAMLLPALAGAEVPVREANNGNVILEAVPEVPQSIVDQLNRYQNVRSASFQDWSEDGQSVYIATRFGDTQQLHHVAMPGGARRQLTFFREPVAYAGRRPQSPRLLFGMDEGGGELFQLFIRHGRKLWVRYFINPISNHAKPSFLLLLLNLNHHVYQIPTWLC